MRMRLDRREFLKAMGVAAGVTLLPAGQAFAAGQSKGVLVDLTKCVGCGWCRDACNEWNNLPPGQVDLSGAVEKQFYLSAANWTDIDYHETTDSGDPFHVFTKKQCMHCLNPACVSACPVKALEKTESGAVIYHAERCIGCRYCMVACPFGIPKYEWESNKPRVRKCTFCADRQEIGLQPACTSRCPTGALLFGDRTELIAEAQSRIAGAPDRYIDHIYGKDEAGGTSWMYISPVSFDKLAFPSLDETPVTSLSETMATVGTGGIAVGLTAVLGGLYYVFGKQADHEPHEGEGEE
jgi:formate dehydrogenase iron-sulfur subunit